MRIIGDGEIRGMPEDEVQEIGLKHIVKNYGARTDTSMQSALFDIFTFPSLWEYMPIVPMEAIAARVLIAASKIDGISGLARDGIEVLLGPPKDTDALQNAILKLLRNSEIGIKRRERSFSRVKEMFGVEVMAKKIELIYSRLLDRS